MKGNTLFFYFISHYTVEFYLYEKKCLVIWALTNLLLSELFYYITCFSIYMNIL